MWAAQLPKPTKHTLNVHDALMFAARRRGSAADECSVSDSQFNDEYNYTLAAVPETLQRPQ